MKNIICMLMFAVGVIAMEDNEKKLDSLEANYANDAVHGKNPKGFIIGRFIGKQEQVTLTPPESLFKKAEQPKAEELAPVIVSPAGYLTMREYDKDCANNRREIDEIKSEQSRILGILELKRKSDNVRENRITSNQEFVIKFLEVGGFFLIALGAFIGVLKGKAIKDSVVDLAQKVILRKVKS